MNDSRERAVVAAFVSIANTLSAGGYDTVDLYSSLTEDCARLLDVASAGLLLADGHGRLHLAAASSERTEDVEHFQLQRDEGPCVDCFREGAPVYVADLRQERARWPQFVPAAEAAGFRSVHALPMRLRDTVLGALGLFGTRVGTLDKDDLHLVQALADVASLALIVNRASTDQATINRQLQEALNSRIVVEQAKGVLAQTGSLDMDQAFAILRRYARDHGQGLANVAARTVSRELPGRAILDHARAKGVELPSS